MAPSLPSCSLPPGYTAVRQPDGTTRLYRAPDAPPLVGTVDGMVAACVRPSECDPRGAFIRRPDLAESQWPAYRDSFLVAFQKAIGGRR